MLPILDEAHKHLRNLAKSNYYQTIFSQHKEIGCELFYNKNDLTHFQITFLNYLSFYSTLYLDIAMGEIDDFVLKDTIYEDAYMYWRSQKHLKNLNKDMDIVPQKPTEKPKTKVIFGKRRVKK